MIKIEDGKGKDEGKRRKRKRTYEVDKDDPLLGYTVFDEYFDCFHR